jgi:hypothetical protein
MRIDLDKLATKFPALYKTAVRMVGHDSGVRELNLDNFPYPNHKYLVQCAAAEPLPDIAVKRAPPAIVPLPALGDRDIDAELKADMERISEEAHAKNRLNEYASIGLLDTQANANLIRDEINREGDSFSVEAVDKAIKNLGDKLAWRPEEKGEVLSVLPDGTTQLPLDVDNRTLQRASKEQARDYLKRVNAGKIIRPSGSFISSF